MASVNLIIRKAVLVDLRRKILYSVGNLRCLFNFVIRKEVIDGKNSE